MNAMLHDVASNETSLRQELEGQLVGTEDPNGGFLWHDLSVVDQDHVILHPCSGIMYNGQITGLLGPSGGGKTTFLTALAGLSPLSVQGLVAGFVQDMNTTELYTIPSRNIAWLPDQDDFFTQLTVEETLLLAAHLGSPHSAKKCRQERVRRTVQQLGLQDALHRRVGDPHAVDTVALLSKLLWRPQANNNNNNNNKTKETLRGRLSGGERRRLSVALELLTPKLLLLADEPTSGLDASYSVVVMKLLLNLIQSAKIPAICCLHQPRSSIYNILDAVILLAPGGRVCYAGSRQQVVEYFASIGYKLPLHTNPAEWLVDLVSIATEDTVQAAKDRERINKLADIFGRYQTKQWQKQHAHDTAITIDMQKAVANPQKCLFQWIPRLGALTRRSWRQNIRDVNLNMIRLVFNITNALLMIAIYPGVSSASPPRANSAADRVSLLSFGAINVCMGSYMKAITLFAQERPIVQRERTSQYYTVAEYLVAKVLAEIPLDVLFSSVFTTILKQYSGLQISWIKLTASFALLTTAGASVGFFLGSIAPSSQQASVSGIPVLVVLLAVGVLNPNGVAPDSGTPPMIVEFLKHLSPFAHAIQALCFGEFEGVVFEKPKRKFRGFKAIRNMRKVIISSEMALVTTGEQVLETLALADTSYMGAMNHLIYIAVGYLIAAWLGLFLIQRHKQ